MATEADERGITGAREGVEGHLSGPVETFAYPGGHVSAAATAVVEREFAAGCTTVLRRATADGPLHSLPRVDMYYLRDPKRLQALAMGRLDAWLSFRRFGRRVRGLLR